MAIDDLFLGIGEPNLPALAQDHASRSAGWLDGAREETTEAATRNEMAAVEAQYGRAGGSLLNEASKAEYEWRYRGILDQELLAKGEALDAERSTLLAQMDQRIEASKSLRPAYLSIPAESDKRYLAELLHEQRQTNVRVQLAGLTAAQIADIYERTSDVDHPVHAAVIEDTMRTGLLRAVSAEDALAANRLDQLIKARREARVPATLREARQLVERTRTLSFEQKLAHLRAGRGIARRPKVA